MRGSLTSLERDLRACRACVEAGHPLESLPVLAPAHNQRAYLYGQAPGVQEGLERRPWRGRAGRTLRGWLDFDEDEFYAQMVKARRLVIRLHVRRVYGVLLDKPPGA